MGQRGEGLHRYGQWKVLPKSVLCGRLVVMWIMEREWSLRAQQHGAAGMRLATGERLCAGMHLFSLRGSVIQRELGQDSGAFQRGVEFQLRTF